MYNILIFINIFSITLQSVPAGIFCDDHLKEVYLIDKETGKEKKIAEGNNADWKTPNIFEDLDADPGDKIKFKCQNILGSTFGAGCFLINNECYCYMFKPDNNDYNYDGDTYQSQVTFTNGKPCDIKLYFLKEKKSKNYYYQNFIPLDAKQIECMDMDNNLIIVQKNVDYALKFSDYIKSPFKLKNLNITIDGENYKYFTLNKTELSPGKNFSIESNLTFLHNEHTKIKVEFTSYSIVVEGTKTCELDIRVCYDSCIDCYNDDADNDNHQCKKCKNDYFFIEGTRNCMTKEEIENIGGYYFDENDNKFKKCYSDCFHCTEKGDENDMKCSDCKEPKENYAEPNNCIEDKSNYYYSEEKRKWIKCYETCEGCNATSNEITHNCKECNKDYYFVYNEPGKCISYDEKPSNTYFDTETERFEKCNERCQTCENFENCTECYKDESNKYIYHFVENEKGKCISENELNTLSFLDENDNTYKLCPRGTVEVKDNKCISRSAAYLVFFIITIVIIIILFACLVWTLVRKKNEFNIKEESKDMIKLI